MFVDEFQLSVAALTSEVALVSITGELDVHTSSRLREGVDEAASTGAKAVIVDLSGVSLIDSTALGVLVQQAKSLEGRSGLLLVVTNDPRTMRVFELTGLDRVLRIYPALPDALGVTLPAEGRLA